VQEPLQDNSFTALLSNAGGKRLVTTGTMKVKNFVLLMPNPASNTLEIRYAVQEKGSVEIAILDVSGNTIATPLPRSSSAAGFQTQSVQTLRMNVSHFPSGSYVVRMTASDGSVSVERLDVVR
jgi:Secretion system C-terminal sorting domain